MLNSEKLWGDHPTIDILQKVHICLGPYIFRSPDLTREMKKGVGLSFEDACPR
jgi:hypothetical protein